MVANRICFTKPDTEGLLDVDYPVCGADKVIAEVEIRL